MTTQKWRFPDNNYTSENGLDTSDMEMFKKDPVSSLAREICQNSIDAAFGEKPVRVEFSLFQVARGEVPGVDDLAAQIDACYKYKKDSPKEEPTLRELKKSISRDTITCLRVSDFNTSGIFGVKVNKSGVPFYDLTKGSGVSNKGGSSGGSKGIGKFASFVVSTTNTVFYSTKANDGTSGFIGISKLRSAPIPERDENLLTLGVGYYAETEKNLPILRELHLDKGFVRSENQYGTDVYIIGFNNFKGWQYDIIAKVLESFMVAVMCGGLEVIVDGIVVNQNTVSSIIYDEVFQGGRGKIEYREIRAQYELLQNDESVIVKEIPIDENNTVTVYLKQYGQQDESNATKHCVMVRYPYMKITYINPGAFLPFSALYGDNVFEKDGIRRDRTGDGEKTRCLCGKRGIFNRDGPAMGPQIIRQLERRASRRSASFFHALASPGRPRNGGGASGAYQPAEGRKALIQGRFRAQEGPLGPSRKSQQQTKRTGFAALEDSIADEAPEGKRAKRANRALNRAGINGRGQKQRFSGADRRAGRVTSR